ncbi:MAG: caspase family protein, partial [Cyanobacteria bacterium J06553_1]
MANHWAITIGINQYRHLQPLMHAQSDALFTHRFLTEDADIPSDHCVLLSDLTTSVGHQVVYPDKPAIAQWIQTITQQVSADDVLWFFFSGYGSQINGADYLMAIDGDPGQIESTGMAVTDLFEILSQLPTNKVLVVLDINRSQGALAGQAIGNQAIELAEAHQVATLLSCQPEQYSHETLGVRHGLFTAALLESLQQNCTTPSQIFNYLTKRLPELCDHHWRPIQNPVGIIPEAVKTAVIVPTVSSTIASRGIAAAELTDTEGAATEDTAAAVSRYEE